MCQTAKNQEIAESQEYAIICIYIYAICDVPDLGNLMNLMQSRKFNNMYIYTYYCMFSIFTPRKADPGICNLDLLFCMFAVYSGDLGKRDFQFSGK